MKYITIKQTGGSHDAFKAGFIKACEETASIKSSQFLLMVPQKSNLTGNIIEDFLGRKFVKRLSAGETAPLGDTGLSVRAKTRRTIELSIAEEVILAAYLTPKDLEDLYSRAHSAQTIIYVAWLEDEQEDFITSVNPEVIDADEYLKKDS